MFGEVAIAASSKEQKFMKIPDLNEINIHPDSAYLHLTSNETIEGAQFQSFPDTGNVPLIGDMSSDILSRPVDVSKFGMIYAGAQKNLGPSGVTVVIVKEIYYKICLKRFQPCFATKSIAKTIPCTIHHQCIPFT